jgi:hypothetical protein
MMRSAGSESTSRSPLEIEVAVSIGVSAARRPAGSRRQLRVSYAPNPHIGRGQASRGPCDLALLWADVGLYIIPAW